MRRPCQVCAGPRGPLRGCTQCGGSGWWNDGEAGKGNKNNPMPADQPPPRNTNKRKK